MLLPIPTPDPTEFCQKEKDDVDEKEDEENKSDEAEKEAEKEAEEDKGDESDAQPIGADSPFHDMPSLEEDISDDDNSSVFRGSPIQGPEQNDTNLDPDISEELGHLTRT